MRGLLPRHKTRRWTRRKIQQIDCVVVHQSVSEYGAEGVSRYHISKTEDRNGDGIIESWERNHISDDGCPAICYTYGIEDDGSILLMNDLEDITWHVRNFNYCCLGIVVFCNASGPTWGGTKEPTEEQRKSLVLLLNYIKEDRLKDNIKLKRNNFFGHCEIDPLNKKNCPGNLLMETLRKWRNTYA